MGYWIIIGAFALIGMLVSGRLKSKFAKYSRVPLSNGKSGAEIAQDMLEHYGIRDVKITQGRGMLTDHYNPKTKTVSLSPEVFQGRHVSAAAVAAHEVGHAVQHATAYSMLQFRSNMVPVVQFAGKMQQMLFFGFMFGIAAMPNLSGLFFTALVVAFGITALFALVTLPVEFDASRRALNWLDDTGNTYAAEYDGAKDALWWAAMTYVVGALSALVVFLYFLLQFLGRD